MKTVPSIVSYISITGFISQLIFMLRWVTDILANNTYFPRVSIPTDICTIPVVIVIIICLCNIQTVGVRVSVSPSLSSWIVNYEKLLNHQNVKVLKANSIACVNTSPKINLQ